MDRSSPWTPSLLAATLLVSGCEPLPAEVVPLEQPFVLVRLAVDPATQIGEALLDTPGTAAAFERGFGDVACDGGFASIVLGLDVSVENGVGLGEGALYLGQPAGGDVCRGTGTIEIDPAFTFDPDGVPRVRGPFYVDGLTIDGRLPIGALDELPQLTHLPTWWRFDARMTELPELAADGAVTPVRLEDAQLSAPWPASQASLRPNPADDRVGESVLDAFVAAGFQPELDLDGDGLESFEDTDGDGVVDRCVDPVAGAVDGSDCPLRAPFADGYDLRLRFLLAPVELTDPR